MAKFEGFSSKNSVTNLGWCHIMIPVMLLWAAGSQAAESPESRKRSGKQAFISMGHR